MKKQLFLKIVFLLMILLMMAGTAFSELSEEESGIPANEEEVIISEAAGEGEPSGETVVAESSEDPEEVAVQAGIVDVKADAAVEAEAAVPAAETETEAEAAEEAVLGVPDLEEKAKTLEQQAPEEEEQAGQEKNSEDVILQTDEMDLAEETLVQEKTQIQEETLIREETEEIVLQEESASLAQKGNPDASQEEAIGAIWVAENTFLYAERDFTQPQFRVQEVAVVIALEERDAAVRILYLVQTTEGRTEYAQGWIRREEEQAMTTAEVVAWNERSHATGEFRETVWLEPVSLQAVEGELSSGEVNLEKILVGEQVTDEVGPEELQGEEATQVELNLAETVLEADHAMTVVGQDVAEKPGTDTSEEQVEENAEEEILQLLEEEEEKVELVKAFVGSVLDRLFNAYEQGLLPAIRNQGLYGDCWAFSGVGGMEADLIADGAADTSIDLSEYFVVYFLSHQYPYPKSGGEGDTLAYTGVDSPLNNGGNNYMIFRMLANLLGTVNEEDASHPTTGEEMIPTRYTAIAAQITGAYLIDPGDRDAVKQAILDHGGVSASINMVTTSVTYTGGYAAAFRENGSLSCLYGTYPICNHDVLLVGWDDDFSVENFSESARPSGDGAWLARNSWGGEGYGPNGYFWVSYEDASLLHLKTTAYDAVNEDLYDFCYSYDKTPYPSSRYAVTGEATMRQVFHVDGCESLRAVGVETASEDLWLTISLLVGGEEVAHGSAFAQYEGFYRVVLDTPFEMMETGDVTVSVTYIADDADGIVRVPFAPARASVQGQIEYTNVSGDGGFWLNDDFYEGDSHLKLYTSKLRMENEVETLTLNAASLEMRTGETFQLIVTLTPDNAVNQEISWTSADPRIAGVDGNGLVTAGKKAGTTVITAMTDRGVYATCEIQTTYQDVAILKSAKVEFDGLIHLIFRYDMSGVSDPENTYVVFRLGGTELTNPIPVSDYQGDGIAEAEYYCPVPIVYYTDMVTTTVEEADGEIATWTGRGVKVKGGYEYSLQTYAEHMASSTNPKMAALAKALQDYGIAARLYAGSDVGNLKISEMIAGMEISTMAVNETKSNGTRPEGVRGYQRVIFEADNTLQVFFILGNGSYTYMRDGAAVKPTMMEGGAGLSIANIAADKLNEAHIFTISDGENTYTVETSVLGYAKRIAEKGSEAMRNLAKALYVYANAASDYAAN